MDHTQYCAWLDEELDKGTPISKHMGVQVVAFTGDSLAITASLEPNINVHGTAFAGSLYCMSTLSGWGFITLQGKTRDLRASVVVASGEISYSKPIQTERINAKAQCFDDLDAVFQTYRDTGKARISIATDIEQGAAAFFGKYVLLSPES